MRRVVEDCFLRRLTTPRQAIRYVNALEFALPMLKGMVNPFEQMIVEGLRVLFPELYAMLRDDIHLYSAPSESQALINVDREKLDQYCGRAMVGSSAVECRRRKGGDPHAVQRQDPLQIDLEPVSVQPLFYVRDLG